MNNFCTKISVVIPYFNSSKHFDKILFSIGPYVERKDFEIIFVDDCSESRESEKLLFFIKSFKSKNIYYLKNEKNLGASQSRKKGVLFSKGKYISFLDTDDIWGEGKLDYQLKIMEENDLIISGCLTKEIEIELFHYNCLGAVNIENSFKQVSFLKFLFKNYFSTPSVMVLRSSIVENNFSDTLRYSEDFECWRRILFKNKGAIIPDLGVFSFKHSYLSGEGLSSNIFKMSFFEIKGLFWLFFNKKIDFKYKFFLPFAIFYSLMKSLRRFFLYFLSFLK